MNNKSMLFWYICPCGFTDKNITVDMQRKTCPGCRKQIQYKVQLVGRGGKREGAGRPSGTVLSPEKKKRNFTTKLSPEWFTFLDEMKERGHSKAWCINQGLELLKSYMVKEY
ncbi:hypothetical protein [Sulfurovum sp.]|uniref:hypothetical protein n=1 Tax=Sulfurovum sp. TaxID=1969726 RepID=UPI0035678870